MITKNDILLKSFSKEENGYNRKEVDRYLEQLADEIDQLRISYGKIRSKMIVDRQRPDTISRDELPTPEETVAPSFSDAEHYGYNREEVDKFIDDIEQETAWLRANIQNMRNMPKVETEECFERSHLIDNQPVENGHSKNNNVVIGSFDRGRAIRVLLIMFIVGFCILVAGISGRIIMSRITEEVMSTDYVQSMDEAIPGVNDILNRGMKRLAIKLTVSLIKNDPSGFVSAVKDVTKSIGSIADSSGVGNLILPSLLEEAAREAFQQGRNQLVESAGAYMPLLQFAANYYELLLIGGIVAGVSLLLWFLLGAKINDIKNIKILCIIGIAWVMVVAIMTIMMMCGVKNPLSDESIVNTQQPQDNICNHSHITIMNYRASTCAEKGYSGDEYCEDCQTIIKQGEEIPFDNHQYENGVCTRCGWRIPGLYVENNLMLTWDQLVENSYITINENSIHKVLNTLKGILFVEEGFDVDSYAFDESALDTVCMPRTYTRINTKTFNEAHISSIAFYGKIERIGESAFRKSWIKSICIPEGVTSISAGCFSDCKLLEDVWLPGTIEVLGDSAFANCEMLKSINLPNGVKSIGDHCFSGSGLESIMISESVTEIGGSCFINCSSLKTVDMSKCAVEKLNKATFSGCTNLSRVDLPNKLVEIDSAFYSKNMIEYLILPETIKHVTLGSNYNFPMESLKWVVWPSSLLDASGFESANNLECVYYTGSEYQWSLVTGKEYSRVSQSKKDIFENATIVFNATESDWAMRLQNSTNSMNDNPVATNTPDINAIDSALSTEWIITPYPETEAGAIPSPSPELEQDSYEMRSIKQIDNMCYSYMPCSFKDIFDGYELDLLDNIIFKYRNDAINGRYDRKELLDYYIKYIFEDGIWFADYGVIEQFNNLSPLARYAIIMSAKTLLEYHGTYSFTCNNHYYTYDNALEGFDRLINHIYYELGI